MWPFWVITAKHLSKSESITVVEQFGKAELSKNYQKMYINKDNLMRHKTDTMCLRLVCMSSDNQKNDQDFYNLSTLRLTLPCQVKTVFTMDN